ncbi:MAG TPA: hypothetical protein VF076_04445 [Acidimicrobiales bacterium]
MSFPPPSVLQESPATPTKIKPGKGWYWLGALLLAGGLLGGLALAVAGFLSLKNTVEDFGRFKVTNGQGSATVSFEKPGTYTIYYESHSKVCQDLTQSGSGCTTETVRGPKSPPAGLSITISKDGTDLDVRGAKNSFDYTLGDYTGKAVGSVKVDEPGAYSMVVQTRREGDFVIALGKDVVSTIVPWLIGALALALVGVVLGLLVLILTGVKRGRRKREAAMAAATQYPSAPPLVATPVPVGASVAPPVMVPAGAPGPTDHSAYAPPEGSWSAPPPVATVPPAPAEALAPPGAPAPPPAAPAPLASPSDGAPALAPPSTTEPSPSMAPPTPSPPSPTSAPPPAPVPPSSAPGSPTAPAPPPPGSAPPPPASAPPLAAPPGAGAVAPAPPPPPPGAPDEAPQTPGEGGALPPPPAPPPGT